VDAVAARTINAGQDYDLSVSLRGNSVSVSLDGQVAAGHFYNAVVVDGGFGLLTRNGASSFDSFRFKTSDPAFATVEAGGAVASPEAAVSALGGVGMGGVSAGDLSATGTAAGPAPSGSGFSLIDWIVPDESLLADDDDEAPSLTAFQREDEKDGAGSGALAPLSEGGEDVLSAELSDDWTVGDGSSGSGYREP
jgi:hypothetical protein